MAKLNLHIFSDTNGFFSNTIVDFINTIQPGENVYLNISGNCANKRKEITYNSISAYLKSSPPDSLKAVIFHSYNYSSKNAIKKIKSKYGKDSIKFAWIFWSHEYYQLPELNRILYQNFSRRFYWRRVLSFQAEQILLFLKGKTDFPFYLGINSFKKTFKEFHLFSAFLKGDYEIVMKDNSNVPYSLFSYLTVKDFPDVNLDFNIMKSDIMIGHAGSPILNHYEIVKELWEMKAKNEIFIPLSYGKKSYCDLLKNGIKKFDTLSISLQTGFLPKDEYYRKIDKVGYFVLNSFCQQALGNIIFFLWNGTKIFVRKNTSTYKTLKEKSFHIFSIEEDLNREGLTNLSFDQKQHNHKLISEILSEENIKNHWLHILNFSDQAN